MKQLIKIREAILIKHNIKCIFPFQLTLIPMILNPGSPVADISLPLNFVSLSQVIPHPPSNLDVQDTWLMKPRCYIF